MKGKMYGLKKVYKQRETSKSLLTEVKLFQYPSERTTYFKKYILGQKNSRVEKVYFFNADIENYKEVDLNNFDEKEFEKENKLNELQNFIDFLSGNEKLLSNDMIEKLNELSKKINEGKSSYGTSINRKEE